MNMDEALQVIDEYNARAAAAEEAAKEAAEGDPAKDGQPPAQEEPKQDDAQKGIRLKEQPPAPKKRFKVPGSIALLLGLILLIVFAISPAFPGAGYTRLQLLLSVILRGGSIQPKNPGGVQPTSGSPSNGSAGGTYYNLGVPGSGSLISGDVGTYG